MLQPVTAVLFALLLLGGLLQPASADELCETTSFRNTPYVVCTAPANNTSLRLFWKASNAAPYRTFAAVANAAQDKAEKLVFAFNAGMYLDNFTPMGLYIENEQTLIPINTRRIDGGGSAVPNFYKAPNGVFYFGPRGAGIATTEAFLARPPEASFATQSGPMLVIDGEIHPAFIADSSDRKRRTGVGVCADGRVRFAISDSAVNFYDFAHLFKEQLACPNALFLDGGRGAGIYSTTLGRNDVSWHGGFGPMVGWVE